MASKEALAYAKEHYSENDHSFISNYIFEKIAEAFDAGKKSKKIKYVDVPITNDTIISVPTDKLAEYNNDWHNLMINPNDLPPVVDYDDKEHWKWYLVRTDYTYYQEHCHYALCTRVNYEWDTRVSPEWLQDDMNILSSTHVFGWKEIN